MNSHSSSAHSSSILLNKLVCHILQKPFESVKSEYRSALQVLSCPFSMHDMDEFSVCEKIKKKFMQKDRIKDALTFVELHRKLQTTSILKYRAGILHFLYCLFDFDRQEINFVDGAALCNFDLEMGLNAQDLINEHINRTLPGSLELGKLLSNKEADVLPLDDPPDVPKSSRDAEFYQKQGARLATVFTTGFEKPFILQSRMKQHALQKCMTAMSDDSNLGSISCNLPNLKALLKDVLYCIQGLRGEIIHWGPEKNNFNVEFKSDFPNPVKSLVLRFLELGWMYSKINNYCTAQNNEKSSGLIAQSFVAALKSKLVDYYKLIAELEALLNQEASLENMFCASNALTLHRTSVWLFEPHMQLKILASVVDACKGKKGGALASVLYSHLQHGDPSVRSLIQNLLRDVTRPLFRMLSNWIYCGELDDMFGEFFVATNLSVPDVNLWQEKYSLNKAMIPSFITMKQARKILSTGKAINFLHQVCQDNIYSRDEDQRIKALELMSTESLFSQDKDANFESILEKNYVKTSKMVLKVLHDKYNLMDHLLAMRNYFLLGQGDFIRHLMDLLDADLGKPGRSLFIHDLSGILESAIRATNAQFHNPDVLQRLDVRLLEVTLGDTGWDVFSLDYHVDGPIGTVFNHNCMLNYFRLFTTLWRAKRMEYILSKISHSRGNILKLESRIPEVTPVSYQCNIILAQMVHFVQQMQYYMAFEVMECCWADLLLKIASANDLDEVIAAHENFISTLITRSLLDSESLLIRTQLKAIYDLIIQFDQIQCKFWDGVKAAVQKLNEMNELIQANTSKEVWGISEEKRREYQALKVKLIKEVIPKTKAEFKILSHSYEDLVQKFLLMLNDEPVANMHFLSFRLDFNEYFKCRNSRLQTSLTYQHRRKSLGVGK